MRTARQVLEDNLLKIDVNITDHKTKMIGAMTDAIEEYADEFAVNMLRYTYQNHMLTQETEYAMTYDNAHEILMQFKQKQHELKNNT